MDDIIRTIQETDREALQIFSEFCEENGIRFFLRGGSVLGAVKYGGFIPWDDDLDVAVPREDYEKLIRISRRKLLGGKFRINSYRHCRDLHCYFPRMVLTETERIRLGLPKTTNLGFHIMDIFPLDGAPNGRIQRRLYILHVYILRMLASLGTHYTGSWVNMHSKKQEMVIRICRLLRIDRMFPQRSVYARLERLYRRYDWRKQAYAGTITASLFAREIMPAEIWGQGAPADFSGIAVTVPEQYDRYLRRLYGEDYLEVEPDEKDRKSHLGKG